MAEETWKRTKWGKGHVLRKHRNGHEMSPALLHALNHPVRRQLLRSLNGCDEPRSPRELTDSVKVPLSNLAYHMKVLQGRGIVRLARTRKVRGSTEHFYASAVAGNEQVASILASTEGDDGKLRKQDLV